MRTAHARVQTYERALHDGKREEVLCSLRRVWEMWHESRKEKSGGFLCHIKENGFYSMGNRVPTRILELRSKLVSLGLRRILWRQRAGQEWWGKTMKEGEVEGHHDNLRK